MPARLSVHERRPAVPRRGADPDRPDRGVTLRGDQRPTCRRSWSRAGSGDHPLDHERADAAGRLRAVGRREFFGVIRQAGPRAAASAGPSRPSATAYARPAGTWGCGWSGHGLGRDRLRAAPRARGRSRMSTAVRLVRDCAFDVAGLTTLRWRAIAGNWGSRRVAAAAGFVFDGTVRRLLVQRGTLRDGWVATMTREDPRTPRRGLVPVELLGDGLVLRPFVETDADRIVEACSDPRTRHWLVSLPRPYAVADALSYLEHTRELAARYRAGLVRRRCDDDRCLGSIGLEGLSSYARGRRSATGPIPQARGRGAVTAAVRLVTRLCPVRGAGGLDRDPLRGRQHRVPARRRGGGLPRGRTDAAGGAGRRRELSELVLYAQP